MLFLIHHFVYLRNRVSELKQFRNLTVINSYALIGALENIGWL